MAQRERTIEVAVGGKTQRFTVTNDSEVDEIRNRLPDGASIRVIPGPTLFAQPKPYDVTSVRPATIMAGGLGGAAYGGAVGGPPGALIGGVLGAGAGALGYEMGAVGAERAGLIGEGTDIAADPFAGTGGPLGPTQRALNEMAYEAMGSGLVASFKPIVSGLYRRLAGIDKEGEKVLRAARHFANEEMPYGIEIGIERATGRSSLSSARQVFGKFPWIGTRFREVDMKISDQLGRVYNKLVTSVGKDQPLESIGGRVIDWSARRWNELSKIYGKQFDDALEMGDEIGSTVNMTATRTAANDIVNMAEAGTGTYTQVVKRDGREVVVNRALPRATYSKVLSLAKKYRTLNPFTLRQWRGQVDEIQKLEAAFRKNYPGASFPALEKLRAAMRVDIEGLRHGPDGDKLVLHMWQKAEADLARFKRLYNESPTGRKFEQLEPGIFSPGYSTPGRLERSEVFKTVFNAGNTKALVDLRKIVGGKNFNLMAVRYIDDALESSVTHFDKPLYGFRSIGKKNRGHMGFDIEKLRNSFGLGRGSANAERRRAVIFMLKNSKTPGSGVSSLKDIEAFIDVLEAAQKAGTVDVGQFMQRRAALGGIRAVTRGLTTSGFSGAAGEKAKSGRQALWLGMKGLMVMLALKQGSKILTNPEALKAATVMLKPLAPARSIITRGSKRSIVREQVSPHFKDGIGLHDAQTRKYAAAWRFIRLMPPNFFTDYPEEVQIQRLMGSNAESQGEGNVPIR